MERLLGVYTSRSEMSIENYKNVLLQFQQKKEEKKNHILNSDYIWERGGSSIK